MPIFHLQNKCTIVTAVITLPKTTAAAALLTGKRL